MTHALMVPIEEISCPCCGGQLKVDVYDHKTRRSFSYVYCVDWKEKTSTRTREENEIVDNAHLDISEQVWDQLDKLIRKKYCYKH